MARAPKNRLASETSPYLLQHAENPVDWYPWGEEAFRRAGQEKKPVLLSIGYSACHWCHVMAHESFEDLPIAQLMNSLFISIKVDREEYPDVDHFYQTFVQLTTGRGGWPLTVFLTPEKIPFYGGTYFPSKSRYGMISFPELLHRISDLFQNESEKITRNSQEIRSIFEKMDKPDVSGGIPDDKKTFQNLYRTLEKAFDPIHGGFGPAPKFPHASDLNFLLAYYHYTGIGDAKKMVLQTLQKMAWGGIYDQIGGGFHRYSTDEKWLVPHFEKMLYDNALLASLYADAYRLSGDKIYRNVSQQTADFVLRELNSPDNTFYAALDADSEGEEGKYYLWKHDEILSLLNKDSQKLFCEYYQISEAGNFEGKNLPHVLRPLETISKNYGLSASQAEKKIQDAADILLEKRQSRIQPLLDNKVLLDWNSMMISALWKVCEISGKIRYRQAAEKALNYFLDTHVEASGLVYHFIRNDQRKIDGYIDDYAYLIQALIDGFEGVQDEKYLQFAEKICLYALQNFWDDNAAGFYFTHKDGDIIMIRQKQTFDSSVPSGNNIMTVNLLRLHAYTGNKMFLQKAERIFQVFQKDIESRGIAFSTLVTALLWYTKSPLEITVSIPDNTTTSNFISQVLRTYIPCRVLVRTAGKTVNSIINPELIENRLVRDQETAFICHRGTCSLPLIDADQFISTIQSLNLHIR